MPDPEPSHFEGSSSSTADASASRQDERIGAYRLERPLGCGGMGEVFLARDERLGRRVAIKRVRPGTSPALRERLRREVRAAARLSHPAVVQIYDILEDGAGDAIVLEYAEGRTLRALLADGLPPPAVAVRLAREIAGGLAAAHDAGLVHRDFKAENVVVTPDGHEAPPGLGRISIPKQPFPASLHMTQASALTLMLQETRITAKSWNVRDIESLLYLANRAGWLWETSHKSAEEGPGQRSL